VPRFTLCLASASPRRVALLRQAGFAPLVRVSAIDERPHPGEAPRDLVLRLAESKARAVAAALAAAGTGGHTLLLAADTEVVLDGEVLGKPHGASHAMEMLRRLRGRSHEVLTGVFLLRTDDGRSLARTEETRVTFAAFGEETIRSYVAAGEGLDKAGAYAIQGRGAGLATRIEGSWSNVVGLPIERLPEWLAALGVDLQELARPTGAQPFPTSSP
jgi:septum formation protein